MDGSWLFWFYIILFDFFIGWKSQWRVDLTFQYVCLTAIRIVNHKILNVCPLDYIAFVDSGKVGIL